MDIKLNRGIAITLSLILMILYTIGFPVVAMIYDVVVPGNNLNLSLVDLLASNLRLTLTNLDNIIIGFGLFFFSAKIYQDRWTWMLIGLAFGTYAIIFIGLLLIIKPLTSKKDLLKFVTPILILLIIAFFVKQVSNPLISIYEASKFRSNEYFFLNDLRVHLPAAGYAVIYLVNIFLAVKMGSWTRELKMKKRLLWIISTVIFGLFPIILFNELVKIGEEENAA